jgi:hypothetical protein
MNSVIDQYNEAKDSKHGRNSTEILSVSGKRGQTEEKNEQYKNNKKMKRRVSNSAEILSVIAQKAEIKKKNEQYKNNKKTKRRASNSAEILSAIAQDAQIKKKNEQYKNNKKMKRRASNSAEILSAIAQDAQIKKKKDRYNNNNKMKLRANKSSEILSAIAQKEQIKKKNDQYNDNKKIKLPVSNSTKMMSAIALNEEQDEIRYNSEIMSAIANSEHQKKRKEEYNVCRKKKHEKKIKLIPSSVDAANYEKAYDEETKYIVCAVCGREGSRKGCIDVGDNAELIDESGIREQYIAVTTVNDDTSVYDTIFINELSKHFIGGLLKCSNSICSVCSRQMKQVKSKIEGSTEDDINHVGEENIRHDDNESNKEVNRLRIPKLAYINGLFPGSIPLELQGLTIVEDSMINIYSAISNVTLEGGKFYKMKRGTCYTIINDLTSVAKQLPRMPTIETTAIIRHCNTSASKEYTYRPYKIFSALTWLKTNNHLYAQIELVWPSEVLDWQNDVSSIDIPYIELSDVEQLEIEGEAVEEERKSSDDHSTNTGRNVLDINYFEVTDLITYLITFSLFCLSDFTPILHIVLDVISITMPFTKFPDAMPEHKISLYIEGSAGQESEILLETHQSLVSQLKELQETLRAPVLKNNERNAQHEFVCQYKNPEYYLPRCFATLYPYGRGCPCDKYRRGPLTMAKYISHSLCVGGGPFPRRFQNSAKYIFSTYTMEMKRKVGGVAYVAQRKKLDGKVNEQDILPTINDIKKLLSYLEATDVGDLNQPLLNRNMRERGVPIAEYNENTSSTTAAQNDKDIQKLIKRLVPYSKSLQGTAPHIAYERTKLMAMISSQIISDLGNWRYFFTTAPADLYDNRLYEVVQSSITDNSSDAWNIRTQQVR